METDNIHSFDQFFFFRGNTKYPPFSITLIISVPEKNKERKGGGKREYEREREKEGRKGVGKEGRESEKENKKEERKQNDPMDVFGCDGMDGLV